jgi:hypothetical protein
VKNHVAVLVLRTRAGERPKGRQLKKPADHC